MMPIVVRARRWAPVPNMVKPSWINPYLPAATRRFAVCVGLSAALLTGVLVASAFADDHDGRNRGHNEPRHEQARQQERWRDAHRYDDYDRRPSVYYSAPPVVYAPPAYYRQPAASLNFSFPFFR